MDELVFYVKRANGIVGVVATTPFILAGSAMVVAGFVIAAGAPGNVDDGYTFAIIGVLGMAPFCFFFVQSVRTIRSPGRLRLTDQGFDVYKHSFSWTDVEDFHTARTGGDSPTDYVKVVWAPGVEQHPAVRRSARLEKLGQKAAPTYIQFGQFDTGGVPLQEILRRWRTGDRAAGRPIEPR
ncbi:hypothetical protein AB0K11_24245 [Mycobacterium sp. NPDC050551]|uniref:hypothetical protein n=1 Tax=Mycobacterium sp. NPDC050551 TaxID=3155407 RepID=UPI003447556E